MNIIEIDGYKLSVKGSEPDKYSNRSHFVFHSQTDDNPKVKEYEMMLSKDEIAKVIDYLQNHLIKIEQQLFD